MNTKARLEHKRPNPRPRPRSTLRSSRSRIASWWCSLLVAAGQGRVGPLVRRVDPRWAMASYSFCPTGQEFWVDPGRGVLRTFRRVGEAHRGYRAVTFMTVTTRSFLGLISRFYVTLAFSTTPLTFPVDFHA